MPHSWVLWFFPPDDASVKDRSLRLFMGLKLSLKHDFHTQLCQHIQLEFTTFYTASEDMIFNL